MIGGISFLANLPKVNGKSFRRCVDVSSDLSSSAVAKLSREDLEETSAKELYEQQMYEVRRLAFFSVIFSTAATVVCVICLPMAYTYVQYVHTTLEHETEFCRAKSANIMTTLREVEISKFGRPVEGKVARRLARSYKPQRGFWYFGKFFEARDDNKAQDDANFSPDSPQDLLPLPSADNGDLLEQLQSGQNIGEELPTPSSGLESEDFFPDPDAFNRQYRQEPPPAEAVGASFPVVGAVANTTGGVSDSSEKDHPLRSTLGPPPHRTSKITPPHAAMMVTTTTTTRSPPLATVTTGASAKAASITAALGPGAATPGTTESQSGDIDGNDYGDEFGTPPIGGGGLKPSIPPTAKSTRLGPPVPTIVNPAGATTARPGSAASKPGSIATVVTAPTQTAGPFPGPYPTPPRIAPTPGPGGISYGPPPPGQCCTCQQGEVGPPGKAGADGKDGVDGKDGNPGTAGIDALPTEIAPPWKCDNCPGGPPGPPGVKGPKGPLGPAGDSGQKKSNTSGKGAPGPPGPAGPPGQLGPLGPKGEAGPPGQQILTTGPPGLAGPPGATGSPGNPGPAGKAGGASAVGPIGPLGDQGDSGQGGKVGLPGKPGDKGGKGPPGPCGHCPPARLAPGY